MHFSLGLAYLVAVVTAGIAALTIKRSSHSLVAPVFIVAMILSAIDLWLMGFAYQSQTVDVFSSRQYWRLLIDSLLPGWWLLFSICFSRSNYLEQIAKWKWILLASFVLPFTMVTLFHDAFFSGALVPVEHSKLFLPLGWAGYFWHLLRVSLAVLIFMNLERTFRRAAGYLRWQTKFMFLGTGSIIGVHLLADSMAILFKGINADLNEIWLITFLAADIFILLSLFRGNPLSVSIHLSHQFIYNSLTLFLVGGYLIFMGALAWISLLFGWVRNIEIAIFLMFLAIIGIISFLISDRFRLRRKRFVSRHFLRPRYDYQKIWEDYTEKSASVTQTRELCDVIVKMISETLDVLAVSIWLVDESQEALRLGGSTVFSADRVKKPKLIVEGGRDKIQAMSDQASTVNPDDYDGLWREDLKYLTGFKDQEELRARYCVPLKVGNNLIGIMTLGEKVLHESFSIEESELLKTIANQAAANLLNLELLERIRLISELETFRAMSAFFLHDLKNLAAKLSLVTRNMSVHMDNPEFRKDALHTISQSVCKINAMSSHLSLLSQKPHLIFSETDLNALVSSMVSEMKEYIKAPVSEELDAMPLLYLDRNQVHKVMENLLMNAYEAAGENGHIVIATRCRENWAEISVRDNGGGISTDFLENHLFRPFRTTKKQGMGIGLYYCKTIIEAHCGKIEVESQEGRGTVFSVLFPLKALKERKNELPVHFQEIALSGR